MDIEKAYDSALREDLWHCTMKSGVAEKYGRVVQDMYENSGGTETGEVVVCSTEKKNESQLK